MIPIFNLRLCCHKHVKQTLAFTRDLSTSELKKYYAILNVTKDSTAKEIKESFLRLSKLYHPDNKTTGSHLKFVQLKEAYDAVKDGPPATTDYRDHYSQTSNSSYSPFDDVKYRTYYRQQSERYDRYSGFGGPYANSSTPWEDFKRDREYDRQRQRDREARAKTRKLRPLVQLTLVFSAIAWIVIYSSVLLVWDTRGTNSRYEQYQRENYAKYLELEAMKARMKARRLLDDSHRELEKHDISESESPSKPLSDINNLYTPSNESLLDDDNHSFGRVI